MPSTTPHDVTVLLIEDEAEIRRFLRTTLPPCGYRLYEATTGSDGLAQASARNPDLILLDLGLPDMNGTTVIEKIRAWSNLPIIVLSARDQEQAKVEAFDIGADDYVTKPFGMDELLARMRAALDMPIVRRVTRSIRYAPSVISASTWGEGRSSSQEQRSTLRLSNISCSQRSYGMPGKVVTHRQLLKEVWGPLHIEEGHYVRVYMRQLRSKVEADPAQPRHLVTELGVGYRLRTE